MNHSYTCNGYRDIGLNTKDVENTEESQFLSTNYIRKYCDYKHLYEPYITVLR